MIKRFLNKTFVLITLLSVSLISCSSGDGDVGGDNPPPSGGTTGQVPENNDSGKNNNSEPDNINPGGTGGSDNPGSSGGNTDNTSWNLVFEDNFEGSSSQPDPQKWKLAKKGDDTWNRYLSESYDQAYQKDGYLYLFGMLVDGEYKTGAIETQGLHYFTDGQVKCRARFLRQPQGNHTGIWMMPEPGSQTQKWPKSGEIDIMEHLDDQKVIYETVHFWNEEAQMDDSKDTKVAVDNDDFNVYGVIWDNKSLSFTVNGEVKFTYSNEDPGSTQFSYQYPFTEPFYLILSQSLGGKGTWEGVIDDSELPAIFQIDWIKVWQKK